MWKGITFSAITALWIHGCFIAVVNRALIACSGFWWEIEAVKTMKSMLILRAEEQTTQPK